MAHAWAHFVPLERTLVLTTREWCLVYHRIWKNGNEAISASLRGAAARRGNASWRAFDARQAPTGCQGLPRLDFTFVREPMQRFHSGFAEYEWRRAAARARSVTVGDAATFVQRLLNRSIFWRLNEPRDRYALLHTAPQAGVLRVLPPGARVGRIERSSSDWAALLHGTPLAGVPLLRCAPKGCHPSSADPQGARASLSTALRADPALRERLCALLTPDYELLARLVPGAYNRSACRDPAEKKQAVAHYTSSVLHTSTSGIPFAASASIHRMRSPSSALSASLTT